MKTVLIISKIDLAEEALGIARRAAKGGNLKLAAEQLDEAASYAKQAEQLIPKEVKGEK